MSQSVFVEPLASWHQIKSKIKISHCVIAVLSTFLLFYTITELLHARQLHTLEFTPANVFTGSIWQLVTAGFTEKHFLVLLINMTIILMCNRYLEPVWGSLEYIKFILVVTVATYSINLVIYFIGYILLREESFLYAPFCGGQGLVGGMLVGVKQLIPDHVMIREAPFIRVRHLPLSQFLAALLFTLLRVVSTRYLTVTMAGLTSSWIYLRYFQLRDTGRGDFSEALSLASFFPESAQPHVLKYSTAITNAVDGMLQKRNTHTVDLKSLSSNVNIINDSVTERRRQIAIQALNERLQQTEDVDWPSSDNEEPEPDDKTVPENIV